MSKPEVCTSILLHAFTHSLFARQSLLAPAEKERRLSPPKSALPRHGYAKRHARVDVHPLPPKPTSFKIHLALSSHTNKHHFSDKTTHNQNLHTLPIAALRRPALPPPRKPFPWMRTGDMFFLPPFFVACRIFDLRCRFFTVATPVFPASLTKWAIFHWLQPAGTQP